jgi:hypothetical protein
MKIDTEQADLERDLADAQIALDHAEQDLTSAQEWAVSRKTARDAAAKRLQDYKFSNQ